VQGDEHLITLIRYVGRNPLRAKLIECAVEWKYSSRLHGSGVQKKIISIGGLVLPKDYLKFIQIPLTPK
jgi:putative transposase